MPPLIVTAAIIRRGEEVLITRRPAGSSHAGRWKFPGGKLDGEESPEECPHREILEELGLEVAVGEIVEVVYFRYDWGPALILAFLCRPLGGEIRNLQVAEHRWVSPGELAAFDLLPADWPIVEKLAKLG